MELAEAIERPRIDGVRMRRGPRANCTGSIALVGHHLIFSPQANGPASGEFWLLHRSVDRVAVEFVPRDQLRTSGGGFPDSPTEASPAKVTSRSSTSKALSAMMSASFYREVAEKATSIALGAAAAASEAAGQQTEKPTGPRGGVLTLRCKNFLVVIFEIDDWEDAASLARTVETLSNLNNIALDYAFYYRAPFTPHDDGWVAFDVEQEFARLSVKSGDAFRISSANRDFALCPTYPELVVVPKGIGDDYLRIAATFRDGARFPVVAYWHESTRTALVRCGQPLVGPVGRRCREDETILNALLNKNGRGAIVDTRCKDRARNAKTKGGGSEAAGFYSQWRSVNCGTPTPQEAHESLAKLVEAANDSSSSSDRWLSRVASSGWLPHVADCLTAAATVAQCMEVQATPVVVHGSAGTDSTLVVSALAQVLLDPDSRTVRGFEALVERQWIAAGHPFQVRTAHAAYATGTVTGPEEGPVFLLFLDCVYQLLHQFARSFEFDEQLLVLLFEHAYASEFGSFLGNCEKDKKTHRIKGCTVSLWSYINCPEVLRKVLNSTYEPNPSVLWPSVAPQSIVLWERLFLRWQRDWREVDVVRGEAARWISHERDLIRKAEHLRRELLDARARHVSVALQTTRINSN